MRLSIRGSSTYTDATEPESRSIDAMVFSPASSQIPEETSVRMPVPSAFSTGSVIPPASPAVSPMDSAKKPADWSKGLILCGIVEFYAILSLLASMLMLIWL